MNEPPTFRFSLANFLLMIVPVAVVFGVMRALDYSRGESAIGCVLVVVLNLSIAIGAIQCGAKGMWHGLLRGLLAIVIAIVVILVLVGSIVFVATMRR
jgi:hypothetical protein